MSNKDTKGKLRMDLIPPRALISIAEVREFGNSKYKSPWGWLDTTNPTDFITAAKRHLLQIDLGHLTDDESGLTHLSHALTSLAMAQELFERGAEWGLVSGQFIKNPLGIEEPLKAMCMDCFKNDKKKKKSCKKKFCDVQLV